MHLTNLNFATPIWRHKVKKRQLIYINQLMAGPAYEEDVVNDFTSQISGKLETPIASGSFGEVYRCTVETSIGEMKVAVKVFRIDTRTIEKLKTAVLRELRVWLRLKHPTIVPLLGTAQVDSPLPALVSPWMSCGKLAIYLTTTTHSGRIKLVRGIAEGLNYLHLQDVIHGDLHPGNILIDGSGCPRLTDFGLATVAEDPELQWTTMTAGRSFDCRWRAPEIIGIDVDPGRPTFKSDIYSFGSVTFFVISGDIPWKDKRHSPQICIELSKRITPARPYNISDSNWNLIRECWSWDPVDRPNAVRVLHRVQVIAEYSQERSTSYDSLQMVETTPPIPRFLSPSQFQVGRTSNAITPLSPSTTSSLFVSGPLNVLIFGGTGVGKSSVINLIMRQDVAQTSADAQTCMLEHTTHEVTLDGRHYKLWEVSSVASMNLFQRFLVKKRYKKMYKENGVYLHLYCIRRGRAEETSVKEYKIFTSIVGSTANQLRNAAAVVTCLEDYPGDMDDWWKKNEQNLERNGMRFSNHVCITSLPDDQQASASLRARRCRSELVIRQLLCDSYYPGISQVSIDSVSMESIV